MTQGPLKFTVPFDEADGEGIVFFGNYFRLAHRALEAYLPRLGILWPDWFANKDFGVPLRHVEADYLRPLRPGQEYSVDVRVADLSESSAVFTYEFKGQDGEPIARVRTAHVFAGRADFRKIPIPPELKRKLEQGR